MRITESEYEQLHSRLSESAFRSRFHLSEKDKYYVYRKGIPVITRHADEIIAGRLCDPAEDGKQTPMKGHPVFIAQHATATCCRGCIGKWHGIPASSELTADDIEYIKSVIIRFIEDEMRDFHPDDYGQLDLFCNM